MFGLYKERRPQPHPYQPVIPKEETTMKKMIALFCIILNLETHPKR